MDAAPGKPVYLLQTPDGSEGKSTLPTLDMPAGYEGAVIVSVACVIFTSHCFDPTFTLDPCQQAGGNPAVWQ